MWKRIGAFEMWLIRRMLKISYTQHKTNQEVLNIHKQKITLSVAIKIRKCKYFGHLKTKDYMQRRLIETQINEKHSRGIPPRNWMDGIMQCLHLTCQHCVRAAGCRSTFIILVAAIGENSCDSQIQVSKLLHLYPSKI